MHSIRDRELAVQFIPTGSTSIALESPAHSDPLRGQGGCLYHVVSACFCFLSYAEYHNPQGWQGTSLKLDTVVILY